MSEEKPNRALREFTLRSIACGLIFGVMFGAANAYLGLKAGLTVSTSIPIAVLTAVVFKAFWRSSNALELNMSQTIGSASSSLASGTIFTIPALFMWGIVPTTAQVAVLALLGGLLGIFAMVPLRRLLIVQADKELPYPEGRACAEVIRASESDQGGGRWILIGLALGAALKVAISGFHLLPEEASLKVGFLKNCVVALKIAPALLAVGYIVGFRAASVMVSGSILTAFVLYPLLSEAYVAGAKAYSASAVGLSAGEVKSRFVTYIGAGAVAAAGLVTVIKTGPTMLKSLAAVVAGLSGDKKAGPVERTDRDIPASVQAGGILLLAVVMAFVPGIFAGNLGIGGRLLAAAGVLVFGFVFVPVSSRLVGVIGVSSNPTSAMALLTLVGMAALFTACGFDGASAKATILTVGTVVCIAASKAGDISQDLKTGYLLKATPALQQFGQLIAASVACWAVAAVVVSIGTTEKFGSDAVAAPQATLMKTVIEAVLGESLPWPFVLSGAAIALTGVLLGLPALPLALGIYLPFATMATVFLGGIVRHFVEAGRDAAKGASGETGVLCASGYVAGEGLAGVAIAILAFINGSKKTPAATGAEMIVGLVFLGIAAAVLFRAGRTGGAKKVES